MAVTLSLCLLKIFHYEIKFLKGVIIYKMGIITILNLLI